MDSVKRLLSVQKEERRRYHALNEIRLKKLFINTLQAEFQSRGCVEITMYGLKFCLSGRDGHPIDSCEPRELSQEERERLFMSFCKRTITRESGKVFLGELLQFFEKQIKSPFVCE